MAYSRIFGSNFPEEISTMKTYRDIGEASEEVKGLINQFYTFMDAGNISGATALYEANAEKLSPYYIGCETFNKWEEELYNMAQFALHYNIPNYYGTEEPDVNSQALYSYWIKPL